MAPRPRRLTRRGLLALGGGSALLGACGTRGTLGTAAPATPTEAGGSARPARRISYGDDTSQYVELRMPQGTPVGTVVLLHGGYWLAGYGADQLHPLSEALSRLGYATWNVEYRRLGRGGGFPETFLDVAAAIDLLPERVPEGDVVLVGHSAGGHLAAWAGSRTSATPGGASAVRPHGVVSLSGVLDLTRAATTPGSEAPVVRLMGGTPDAVGSRYALGDPALLVPAACPVAAVHALDDRVVPLTQASRYVQKARAAGGRAQLVSVPGDHLTLIDPGSPSFDSIAQLIRDLFT